MKLSTFSLLNRRFSERSLSLITRFLFGTSLILIITLSYSYNEINGDLINYSEKVNQTHNVISSLNQISSVIYETAYHTDSQLFLQDTAYINKTLAAAERIAPLTKKIDSLVMDNQAQRKRLALLQNHIANFNICTRLLSEKEVLADPSGVNTLYKKKNAEIDSIAHILARMQNLENQLMHSRVRSRDNNVKQIFRYNWIIMLVAVVFLASAFVLLDKELNRNRFYRIDLENKIENLNRSNSELEQFAYVASHDLQEPLRKIRSFTDRLILKHRSTFSDDASQMLNKIDVSAKRMQMLISDLLSFSRIVRESDELKPTNLNTSLIEAKTNLSELILENKASIISDPLPSIEGYASQMTQLFQNLLSNSIKYHREHVSPVINITYQLVEGKVIPGVKSSHEEIQFHLISMRDNGIGFRKEFAEKIFEIFKRLHGQTEFAGTGIGLAICKRVVSNHNGYIFAEGVEGEGANFYIYLPAESLI